jgi:hypothetical protein
MIRSRVVQDQDLHLLVKFHEEEGQLFNRILEKAGLQRFPLNRSS